MSTEVSKPIDAAIVERVLIHGDLKQLSPAQKVSYYTHVCESIGLNPLTRPFEYIVLNGKEQFYAKRDATDQLRKVHRVSVQIVAREVTEDCYVVTARATMPDGRQDESLGAVPIATLKGELRANAMMKCETKAKRRVTLSICGLGMLDESEVDSLPVYIVEAPASAPALPPSGETSSGGPAAPGEPAGLSDPPYGGASWVPPVVGAIRLKSFEKAAPGKKTKGYVITQHGQELGIYDESLASLAEACVQEGTWVFAEIKHPQTGGKPYLKSLRKVYLPEMDHLGQDTSDELARGQLEPEDSPF